MTNPAAVGAKAILGLAIEDGTLGFPTGAAALKTFDWDSMEVGRDSKEDPNTSITGFGGRARGTPGDLDYGKGPKGDLTVLRFLMHAVAEFGSASEIVDLAGGKVALDAIVSGGTGYTAPTVAIDAPPMGGVQATATLGQTAGVIDSIVFTNVGAGYDPDNPPAAVVTDADGSGADITLKVPSGPWLTKIRPGRPANASRGLTVALRESPYYAAMAEFGRRVSDIVIVDAANRRAKLDPTYVTPMGDTTSVYTPLLASGNAGTEDDTLIAMRGRRPNDSNTQAGKSIYLKVISVDTDSVEFAAKYDTKSVLGDGTDFPAGTYGTATFVVTAGQWARVIDSNDALASPIGLFGENFEPVEITVGDQAGSDLSTLFAVDDEFEFGLTLTLTKTPIPENRLSTYHLKMADSDESFVVDSQNTKLSRPYAPAMGSGSRFAHRIDETGDITATLTFPKTLFDRMYRDRLDRVETFPILQSYLFGTPVALGPYYEGIEIFYPSMQVTGVKADVTNKNVLKETVTLEAVQAEETPALPTLATTPFDATVDYPYQINAVSVQDPRPYIGPAE